MACKCSLWVLRLVAHAQVTDAITRKKKEATVEKLETYLKESIVLFGIRHKGVKARHGRLR